MKKELEKPDIKLSGFGTCNEYCARIESGIIQMFNKILSREEYYEFCSVYFLVTNPLLSAMHFVCEYIALLQLQLQNTNVVYDTRLNNNYTGFIVQLHIALKNIQIVTDFFHINTGFLFQKRKQFIQGIVELRKNSFQDLALYLWKHRTEWIDDFVQLRIRHEHYGWFLPNMTRNYDYTTKLFKIEEPIIFDLKASVYAKNIFEIAVTFFEELLAFCFQIKCWKDQLPFYLAEIPENKRDTDFKLRFKEEVSFESNPVTLWELKYSGNKIKIIDDLLENNIVRYT
jgi:hypothetical protein